jgi:hypothetical protein
MKPSKLTVGLALAALLVGASVSQSALARGHGGGRVSFGFYLGGPAYWGPSPFYYPAYPAPYYPAPVVIQSPPQVYVEREAVPEAQSYWYYCAATRGYYPYVRECPGGWQKVAPAPQN